MGVFVAMIEANLVVTFKAVNDGSLTIEGLPSYSLTLAEDFGPMKASSVPWSMCGVRR